MIAESNIAKVKPFQFRRMQVAEKSSSGGMVIHVFDGILLNMVRLDSMVQITHSDHFSNVAEIMLFQTADGYILHIETQKDFTYPSDSGSPHYWRKGVKTYISNNTREVFSAAYRDFLNLMEYEIPEVEIVVHDS